jgi:23S rRNA (cytosine1962-C5)-methyltransferase
MVIVDPPSFAKSAAEIRQALAAYARLTRLALQVLEPGGIFVMASCSSRVTPDAFSSAVAQAAASTGRPLTEVTQTGHALDHPIGFPEGEYLKCIFATAL